MGINLKELNKKTGYGEKPKRREITEEQAIKEWEENKKQNGKNKSKRT